MKRNTSTDHDHDLLRKINLVKNCIKENTTIIPIASSCDNIIQFQTKEDFKIQIRLYK